MEISQQESTYRSNVTITSLIEISNLAIRAIITILIARLLGPEGRGEYALALLVPGIFLSFTSLGIGEASAALLGNRSDESRNIVGCVITLFLCITLLLGFIYYGAKPFLISATRNSINPQLYACAFFYIPITYLWGNIAAVSLGFGLVNQVAWGRLFNNVLFLSLTLAFMFIYKTSPLSILLIFLVAGVAEIVFLIYNIQKRHSISLVPCFDISIIRKQLHFGLKYLLGNIFSQLNRRLDAYIVVFFMGTYNLGIYTVAVSLSEFLFFIPNIFSRVSFSLSTNSHKSENTALIISSVRQIFFVMIVSTIAWAFILKPFITICYSTKFMDSLLPALLLLPGTITYGTALVLGYILVGYNKPQETSKAAAIACIFTVILDFILIPMYGIKGAAIASSIAYTVSFVYFIIAYRNMFSISFRDLLVIRKHDIALYFRYFSEIRDSAHHLGNKQ